MHLVTSMSFATVPVYAPRTSGLAVVVAERRMMSDCAMVTASPPDSGLLDLHEEGLELGRLRIAIADDRCQGVGQIARPDEAGVAAVECYAHGMHRLAIDGERAYPLSDDRHRLDVASVRAHLHLPAIRDTNLLCQRFADLDELLRLDDGVQPRMLGPEVEVLGQAVGRGDVRKLLGLAERGAIVLENPGGGVVECRGVAGAQRVTGQRCLERLVVLGEGALGHGAARKEAADAIGVHDEGPHAERRILIYLVVRHVGAAPGGSVPGDELAARIERLPARVAGRAVVHDAPVGRPGEGPVECLADAGGIGAVAPRHQVAIRTPRAAVDPATRERAAIVAQLREAGELLA